MRRYVGVDRLRVLYQIFLLSPVVIRRKSGRAGMWHEMPIIPLPRKMRPARARLLGAAQAPGRQPEVSPGGGGQRALAGEAALLGDPHQRQRALA